MSPFNAATVGMMMQVIGLSLLVSAEASGFLTTPRRSASIRRGSKQALTTEVKTAMEEALGCGTQIGHEELSLIEQKLTPMWLTLPKNAVGNLDRRTLRYAVFRYFNREWSLHIRGFEPSRPSNASGWGADDILAQRVPAYVESVLESKHKLVSGFTLRDASLMVATIEQLIFDSEMELLEQAYLLSKRPTTQSFGHEKLVGVLEVYMISWLLRTDAETTWLLYLDKEALADSVPNWDQVSLFISGQIRQLEYARRMEPQVALSGKFARQGHNALASQYTFEDAQRIVAGITKSFAAYWDSECANMKAQLYDMDTHRTGRVALAQIHGKALEADWRFGESESYLRELGALDETGWRGKQVIISNYMQSATNCVTSTSHYLVCCQNDCETLLDEIERTVGTPSATPEELLAVVSGMSAQNTLDDDIPPQLESSLIPQLHQIAAAHGGDVPLHGRLFAQWLHFAFPRDCAFPHKSGVAVSKTAHEYGDSYYATQDEMLSHANDSGIPAHVGKEELQWMSQWSEEEELMSEHGPSSRTSWGFRRYAIGSLLLLVLAGSFGFKGTGRKSMSAGKSSLFMKGHV